jgi:hypothetical protein
MAYVGYQMLLQLLPTPQPKCVLDATRRARRLSIVYRYTGERNEEGTPHGKGTVLLLDGSTYAVCWHCLGIVPVHHNHGLRHRVTL